MNKLPADITALTSGNVTPAKKLLISQLLGLQLACLDLRLVRHMRQVKLQQ